MSGGTDMYCMNCGIKYGDSEKRCPLCGLPAYHPDIKREAAPALYPEKWEAVAPERSSLCIILTVSFAVALISCLLTNLLMTSAVTWSGYVIAGVICAYVLIVLPLWFSRPNMVIFVPVDFVAVCLLLLYINLKTGGHWFLSFAFPVTGMYCLLFSAFTALAKYLNRGWFFILGGFFIALGGSTMLLEFFESITFETPMFLWSPYPAGILCSVGLFWILAGIIKPLGNAIKKRMFI